MGVFYPLGGELMAGPNLPTDLTASSTGHVTHTNLVHAVANEFDMSIASAVVGQVLAHNGSEFAPGNLPGGPVTPPSDYWQNPANMTSPNTAPPTSGYFYATYMDVGPRPLTVKGLGCNVATAAVLGAATITFTMGVYRDNGTGGLPDLTQLVESVVVTLTSTGVRYGVFASPVVFAPGRYWVASLYVASGSPSTAPQLTTVNAVAPWFPVPSTSPPGTIMRGWFASDQTALPTTQVALAAHSSTGAPVVSLRAN